jgi:hypothetical protein
VPALGVAGEQAGKAAAVEVELDAGRIVLLGFRPEWRGQSFGTFKAVFNAILSASTATAPR